MERIRQLRKERGLSQAKLAVMADMDPATLNRLERGTGNPNLKTLERVAGALGVEVADFFPKTPRRSLLEPSLLNGLEDERRDYESRAWLRVNLLERAADLWQRFIGEGLYDLKKLDLENLKAIDAVSLNIMLEHGQDARTMKRSCTNEQRERLEQAERRLVNTNLQFWAYVEKELASRELADFEAHKARIKARREEWEQASNNSRIA